MNYINLNLLFTLGLLAGFTLHATEKSQSETRSKVANHPNILFCIADDQSFPHAGAYGCKWVKTPAFDRVAKQGLLFTNAYTPNAKCAPSRSSIITGRNSWQLEEAGNHVCYFPDKFKSFFEVLKEKTDYVLGFTGKGVAPVTVTKGRELTGASWDASKLSPPTSGINKNDYAANFKSFLDHKPAEKPFCFWYGGFEPHRPYEAGSGINKGSKSPTEIERVPGFWPDDAVVRSDMLDYAFEIEYFDLHLQIMIEMLQVRGELENTLIVVTSDNGMPFPRCKGTEYELSNHMPLAIMWPAGIANPGRNISDYVSFIDFAPTFLELAGITDPMAAGMQKIQGKSLTPIFSSQKEGRIIADRNYVLLGQERHDVGRPDDVGYPVRSIMHEGMLYIHNFEPDRWPMCNPETGYLNTDGSPTKTHILTMRCDGENQIFWQLCFGKKDSEELYDVRKDPDCLNNLIHSPALADLAGKLKQQLFDQLRQQGDPRMFGNGRIFDQYPYAGPEKDFYKRFMQGKLKTTSANWVNPTDFERAPIK